MQTPYMQLNPITAGLPSSGGLYPPGTSIDPITGTLVTGSGIGNQIPGISQQQQDIMNQYMQQMGALGQSQFGQMQSDVNTINPQIQSLINSAIGQSGQITNQNISAADQLGQKNLAEMTPLMNQYLSSETDALTNPNSPLYQQMAGNLNNSGVFNGGAFNSALAAQLAPLAAQNQLTLGMDTLIPAYQNEQNMLGAGNQFQQGLLGGGTASQIGNLNQTLNPVMSAQGQQQGLLANEAGVQSNLGLDPLQEQQQEYWWNQQKNLANQLAAQGSNAQFGSGMGSLLGGGLGAGVGYGLGGPMGGMIGAEIGSQGGRATGGGLSWICTAMKKRGILTQEEVNKLHDHLFKSFWKRPFKMTMYVAFGWMLVEMAEMTSTDWRVWKTEFYDDVLAEPDSAKAVDLYEYTFWKLYRNVKENLKKQESTDAI